MWEKGKIRRGLTAPWRTKQYCLFSRNNTKINIPWIFLVLLLYKERNFLFNPTKYHAWFSKSSPCIISSVFVKFNSLHMLTHYLFNDDNTVVLNSCLLWIEWIPVCQENDSLILISTNFTILFSYPACVFTVGLNVFHIHSSRMCCSTPAEVSVSWVVPNIVIWKILNINFNSFSQFGTYTASWF